MTLPTQPKDPNDDLYKILDTFLIRGDRKIIAIDTNTNHSDVCRVITGKKRIPKIWEALMRIALKRKEERDAYLQHMGQSNRQQHAHS